MKLLFFCIATWFCFLSSHFVSGQSCDAVLGKWLTGSKKAHIEIYKQADKYFGKIIWLKIPNTEDGKVKVDRKNPEGSLRDRPILGLVNLSNFICTKPGEYEDGKIYDPESGKTYSCTMTLNENGTLSVRGYVWISAFGRSESWFRVK